MDFWLKHNDSDKFKLPVSPSEFDVDVMHKNNTVNVLTKGEVNILGKTGLRSISLSSFFPAQDYSFSDADRDEPDEYISKIENWRTSNTIIRIIISNKLNMECTIESFNWGIKDGTEDVYYTLDLKEYRKLGEAEKQSQSNGKTVKESKKKNKGKARTSKEVKATTYSVKKGDTLWSICKKHYGKANGTLVNKIYEANKGTLKSKNLIYPGQSLKIPK